MWQISELLSVCSVYQALCLFLMRTWHTTHALLQFLCMYAAYPPQGWVIGISSPASLRVYNAHAYTITPHAHSCHAVLSAPRPALHHWRPAGPCAGADANSGRDLCGAHIPALSRCGPCYWSSHRCDCLLHGSKVFIDAFNRCSLRLACSGNLKLLPATQIRACEFAAKSGSVGVSFW